MMEQDFALFCKKNFNLDEEYYAKPYSSLSVCILNAVYSLRAKFDTVTVPLVQRYSDKFMNGNPYAPGDNLTNLIENIKNSGGTIKFAENILNNRQVLGHCLKSDICFEIARKLLLLGINTLEDFKNYKSIEILEIVLNSVKGFGYDGINYLFMLAGDDNRCKPDVHIHHCVRDALGHDLSNKECQKLFENSIKILRKDFPNLSIKHLDGIIWKKYKSKK